MKDQVLMTVTQVLDDSTGIWAGDLTEFGIYTGLLERFLKLYGEKGRQSLHKELDYLKKRVDEMYAEIQEAGNE